MWYQTPCGVINVNSRPQECGPEGFITEICMLVWIVSIALGARYAPFPTNIYLWLWLAGMPACIPIAAYVSARHDRHTTMCREMMYFMRRGFILMRVVFWPITLLFIRYGESQRSAHISDMYFRLREKHHYMKHDTAIETAHSDASKIDEKYDAVQNVTTQVLEVATEIPVAAARTGVVAAALTGAVGSMAYAQDPAANDTIAASTPASASTTSVLILRTGENLQSPHTGTYRLIEFLQVRDKWILPDLGCVDFATGTYRECFVGGGWTFLNSKKVTLVGELYFVQANGSAAHSARYLWVNPILDIRFTKKLTSQASYFPYVPLNRPARVQQVIERAKLEYAFTKSWKVGGGYGAYQFGNGQWQSKPFATTTISTKAGSFEFWLQKMPQGAQAQVRYVFAHTAKH